MRKTIILTAILLAFSAIAAKAQQIVNVSQKGDDIVVEYDLPNPADFVRLYVSLDGGETYRGHLKEVSGDLTNVPAGYNHSITWHVLREFGTDAFESDQVRFKLIVKLKEKWYQETFVTVNGAYSFMPQASFGFSVGQVKPLCARVGVGYGNRTMRWKVNDGSWNRIKDSSFEGVDLSAGLQLNLSHFVMSLEAVTTQFQTIEGKVGVGYAF